MLERNNRSTSMTVELPQRSQITFGGDPRQAGKILVQDYHNEFFGFRVIPNDRIGNGA